jgi:rubrerythrin
MAKAGPDVEILEFAVAREVEAYHFFMALAGRVANPETRRAFEDFAKEELEHKAKLELEIMKMGRSVVVVEEEAPKSKEDFMVSADGPPLDMDYKDILKLGIEKEEASFRTYVNLLGNVDNEESREVLLAIAEEEVKHKLRFELEYNMLLKKE